MIRRAAVLSPEKLKVVRVAQPGPREDAVPGDRPVGGQADRRSTRVAETQQAPDLVERLARGVVHRRAQEPVLEVVAHLDQERVATGHDQRDQRERRLLPLRLAGIGQPAGVHVALEVVDADQRLVVDPGQRLGEVDPDEQRPGEPGAVGDRNAVHVGQSTPAVARASSRTGTIQRRWARAATSGTIPPVGACSATWQATTLAWIRRPSSTSAIPVSSHDDSMARSSGPLMRPLRGRSARPTHPPCRRAHPGRRARRPGRGGIELRAQPRDPLAHRRLAQRLRGHDQRVFVVVAVVARPEADRPEPVLLVEPARGQVGQADLEGRLARAASTARSSRARRSRSPIRRRHTGVHGEGGDVGLVDHQPHPAVGHDLPADACRRGTGRGGSSRAPAVRIGRPGRREGGALDELDGRQVGHRHGPDPQDGGRTPMPRPR